MQLGLAYFEQQKPCRQSPSSQSASELHLEPGEPKQTPLTRVMPTSHEMHVPASLLQPAQEGLTPWAQHRPARHLAVAQSW